MLQDAVADPLQVLLEPGLLEADARGVVSLGLGRVDEGFQSFNLMGQAHQVFALAGLIGVCNAYPEE